MNEQTILLSIEIVTTLFEVWIFYIFFNGFLGKKYSDIARYYFAIGILYALYFAINVFVSSPKFILLNLVMSNYIFAYILYQGSTKIRIVAMTLICVFAMLSETLAAYFVAMVNQIDMSDVIPLGIWRSEVIIISQILFFILVKVAIRFRKGNLVDIPTKNWILLLLIPVVSIIILTQLFTAFTFKMYNPYLLFIAISGILFINMVVFAFFEEILRQSTIRVQYYLMEKQLESQIRYYQKLEEKERDLRAWRHDLKNHFQSMNYFIHGKKYAEMAEYLQKLNLNLEKIEKKTIDTGNPVLDAIVNEKIEIAEKAGIHVKKQICFDEKIVIEPIDICIVLGNALDNAIEACIRISDVSKTKTMELNLGCQQEYFTLFLANTATNDLQKKEGRFLTNKPEKLLHGMGLLNIENAVKKYDGHLRIEYEDNVFTLDIIMRNMNLQW